MKRKLLFVLISIILITTLVLVACDKTEETRDKWGEVYTYETAYAEAKDLGYGGTLQEFIDSIKGNDGENGQDGIGIKFITVNQGNLIVTLSNDTVIDCGNVKGPQGPSGENGEDGITPQLKIGEDNFWYVSYDKGASWTSLGIKATGNDGENGLTPYVGENGNWFIGDFDTGLQAGFVKDQVVVTFHPNGATFDNTNGLYTKIGDTYTIQLDKGDAIASLPLVELAGYEFKGWKTGETVNDGYWKNNWTISANLHLYADLVLIDLGEPDTPEQPEEPIGTEGLEYKVINETEASVSDYTGTATKVTIPNTVTIDGTTYTVTTIGKRAFYWCTSLTMVTISDSITSIGDEAFWGCKNLTSIAIPNSVTSIGELAFYDCSSLTSITIPDSVTSIGHSAFYECESPTIYCEAESKPEGWDTGWNPGYPVVWNVQFVFAQDGITYAITKANFATVVKYTGTATEVTIPGTVTIDGATYTVTTIGEGAFADCTSLTSITIPNSVISIGFNTFLNCKNLTSVTIPDSVTAIGYRAFQYCTSLTSITIPDSVTSIGTFAFANCTSLTSITIPDSVTSIGAGAFNWCYSLTSITIPDSVTFIGERAFEYCHNLTSVNIPDSVTSIGDYAFYECSSLTSITIPNSVTSIGDWAFYGCSSLTICCEAESKPEGWHYNWNPNNYCPVFWNAQSVFAQDGITYAITKANFATVYKYTGTATEVTIPGTVTIDGATYTVTAIGYCAFGGCENLTSITIPDSVTSIGALAFYGCTSLTSITIPDSVTSIGYQAFQNCTSLTTLTIPDGITTIGQWAFYGCSSLTSITIPNSVTAIGDETFYDCRNLTSITIPDSVTSIGNYAFYNCRNLTSITIPDSVTSIGNYAFYYCSSLTIYCEAESKPEGWDTDWNYYNCPVVWGYVEGLEYTLINKTKASVSDYTGTATEVTIPSTVTIDGATYTVTTIGEWAFADCTSLTTVTIPDSVTSIGNYAFWCSSLTSITIPDSVTTIGNYAFYECTSLTICCEAESQPEGWDTNWNPNNCPVFWNAQSVFEDGITYAITKDNFATVGKYIGTATEVTIPSTVTIDGTTYTVTTIGDVAFSGCSNLTSITIPNSVTSIGRLAFSSCDSLTSIVVDENNQNYKSIDGNLYSKDGTILIQYVIGKTDTTFTIPDSVTSIGEGAFEWCDSLTSITIPDSVTSIGDYAFSGCSKLTSITIPDSVTSVGRLAFSSCDSLTSIVVDENNQNYKSIDGNLYSKDGSTLIQYAAGKTATSFTIPNSVTCIGKSAFRVCENLTSITIPNSVTTIGDGAFEYCENLTIYCEAKSKSSNWHTDWNPDNRPVVWGCESSKRPVAPKGTLKLNTADGLKFTVTDGTATVTSYKGTDTKVIIPTKITYNGKTYKVTTIGRSAFNCCSSLTSVTIPNSVTSIRKFAFAWCKNLTSITIPNSVTTVGEGAFEDCDCLTSVTIPNSVTSIGKSAFSDCYSLTSITIPDSVTSIGYWAFDGCTNLTIYCEAKSKPEGWDTDWNYDNHPVVWGYKGE